jgi:hypothetical protein
MPALARLILVTICMAGCAHAPSASTASAPPTLLAPLAALSPRAASQTIHAIYGARAITLRTAIELDASRLTVVGVTATGQRLFTVHWDGREIESETSVFVPANVDPARVLADVQLALWPLSAVQDTMRARGVEVTEPYPGVRRARREQTLVAEVHYATADPWAGRLWLVNFEQDYSLTIDTATATN